MTNKEIYYSYRGGGWFFAPVFAQIVSHSVNSSNGTSYFLGLRLIEIEE
jgi:hypothetical protein